MNKILNNNSVIWIVMTLTISLAVLSLKTLDSGVSQNGSSITMKEYDMNRYDNKDIEARKNYKVAFHVILNKMVKVKYDESRDNYHVYDTDEKYLGRCAPINLKNFI